MSAPEPAAPVPPALGRDFKVTLTMESDWHAGTGAGRSGSVDRLVARDADGLPCIPAKHLTGLLRDACEQAAFGLDGALTGGPWNRWLDWLFGDQPSREGAAVDHAPRPAALRLDAARLPDDLRAVLKDRPVLREALTFVKPGVRVDPATGRATPDFLRFEEMARGGTVPPAADASQPQGQQAAAAALPAAGTLLEASGSFAADAPAAAAALLVAGAILLERIGAKRRRGAGRCRVELRAGDGTAVDCDAWLSWIEQNETPDLPAAEGGPKQRAGSSAAGAGAGDARPAGVIAADGEAAAPASSGQAPSAEAEARTAPPSASGSQGSAPAGTGSETQASGSSHDAAGGSAAPDWVCFDLTLTLQQPLIVRTRTLGNTVLSADFVPGSLLLPVVARTLRNAHLNPDAAIADGSLIVTNATPEVDGHAGRPVPFALFAEKLGGGLPGAGRDGRGVYNRLREKEPDPQLKGLRHGYVGAMSAGRLPQYDTAAMQSQAHNTVDEDKQRPTEDVGGVFTYQAIDEGSVLRSQLRVRGDWLRRCGSGSATVAGTLTGVHRLGTSKKDGYGRVQIKAVEEQPVGTPADGAPADREAATSEQTEAGKPAPSSSASAEPARLVAWLLSDLLLRDRRLRPVASVEALAKALTRELGVAVAPCRHTGGSGLLDGIARQRRTDSWHAGWGLPRPSLAGLAAGTCVVLDVQGPVDPGSLRRLEMTGLGERRAEGFGQLCFNDPLVCSCLGGLPGTGPPDPPLGRPGVIDAGHACFSQVRAVEREAWRQAIRRRALHQASTPERRRECLGIEGDKPSASQLGALRSGLDRLRSGGDRATLTQWLDKLIKRESHRSRWPDGALPKVRRLVDEPGQVWTLLGLPVSDLVATAGGAAALKRELWAEAVRILVDACSHAQKRAGGEET